MLLLASSFGEALSGGTSESKGVRQTSARACSARFCWCAASRVVPNEQRERPATAPPRGRLALLLRARLASMLRVAAFRRCYARNRVNVPPNTSKWRPGCLSSI